MVSVTARVELGSGYQTAVASDLGSEIPQIPASARSESDKYHINVRLSALTGTGERVSSPHADWYRRTTPWCRRDLASLPRTQAVRGSRRGHRTAQSDISGRTLRHPGRRQPDAGARSRTASPAATFVAPIDRRAGERRRPGDRARSDRRATHGGRVAGGQSRPCPAVTPAQADSAPRITGQASPIRTVFAEGWACANPRELIGRAGPTLTRSASAGISQRGSGDSGLSLCAWTAGGLCPLESRRLRREHEIDPADTDGVTRVAAGCRRWWRRRRRVGEVRQAASAYALREVEQGELLALGSRRWAPATQEPGARLLSGQKREGLRVDPVGNDTGAARARVREVGHAVGAHALRLLERGTAACDCATRLGRRSARSDPHRQARGGRHDFEAMSIGVQCVVRSVDRAQRYRVPVTAR